VARFALGVSVSRPGPQARIWDVSYRRGRGRPWYVRWSVNGQERGPKTFMTEDEVASPLRERALHDSPIGPVVAVVINEDFESLHLARNRTPKARTERGLGL